ncbi:MAG: ATP-binding cassette domain-containing protein [Gammaproteobacteria bacterium]|nr:ATP-binding cassette domain-containing protein [Gammaproteobacteria bacterium]
MTQTAPVIRVRDLVTHYGDTEILHGIDLTVHTGEVMVIMGGSGSGKSTLLRHLLGLEEATSGSIEILGEDITRLSADAMYSLRKRIGVSFQGGALFNSMTVAENTEFPLREHTELDAQTIRIMSRIKLELVNLSGKGHLYPAELSGGMIKRAALARAVVMDPRLLFFDEPSAGLDPVVAAELDALILQLRDALQITIVLVTHELESAFGIADRITVLDAGHILISDTVDAVRNSESQRVQSLLHRRAGPGMLDGAAYLQRLTQ